MVARATFPVGALSTVTGLVTLCFQPKLVPITETAKAQVDLTLMSEHDAVNP